ncbi:hypothetical protein [Streptomyces sp. CAU 1734]|uniref:hypothetical protein n=1 Tax=Streptomyces sp. CAU 1734 TaxID=3140360 RepID=UPI003260EDE0
MARKVGFGPALRRIVVVPGGVRYALRHPEGKRERPAGTAPGVPQGAQLPVPAAPPRRGPDGRGTAFSAGTGAPRGAPHRLRVVQVSPAYTERVLGIPVENQRKFQGTADRRGVVIEVRPTNPESVAHLKRGALPKPEEIKAKTINEVDVLLGAHPANIGLVGLFDPAPPTAGAVEAVDRTARPGARERLAARFALRYEEYRELGPAMERLTARGPDGSPPEVAVRAGVVWGRDRAGEWHPFTGDHDLFDLMNPDGSRLDPGPYTEVVQQMTDGDMGVRHGAHMFWKPATPFDLRVYDRIVASHRREGGEPLIRFMPGLPRPLLAYAGPERPAPGQPAPPGTGPQPPPPTPLWHERRPDAPVPACSPRGSASAVNSVPDGRTAG